MTAVDAVRAQRVLLDAELRPATLVLRGGLVLAVEAIDHPVAGEVLDVPDTAYVVPGVVDIHVHVNEPGRTEWEGFATATRAAARGGVTTLVDMPLNSVPPTTTVDHLRTKQRAAAGQMAVDVGFWGGAVPGNLADLEPLWEAGVLGFKCFLSPSGVDEFPPLDPDQLHAALTEVARIGALMVVHAEDAAVLDVAPVRPGRAYADFLHSRPDAAETTAIQRLVDGCRETGARVHVLHLSSARALDVVADAKADGLPLTVETCPHYLCFAAESIPDGAAEFKCCPPIRDSGNRDRLWEGLRAGVIDMVVSDHSPTTPAEKGRGDGDLQQAWGGISGLQVGFAAVAHEARLRGVDLTDVSRWMSRATSDLVGLTTKGRIEVGADADLAVYDPTVALEVDAGRLEHRHPISAYDGLKLDGSVTHTLVRGRLEPDHDWGRQLRRPR
ncbi:allantoinase AllB [Nocardioides sp. MAH-18]|uniref:allantoinase n=1 Tax=Nocardioides agri TaxID=2682843 RepID=A0A6L6XQQ8_9ACTN|nr:allantoinase AllB [Nocardioides sp. CGMCC 1.13656]MBA2954043.1 allantoinase AllB [Nocardioides sp. CGMCC 1.13656]MVQ48906.1 allantoinase AllB [Nocardioides sp. MAH-18]